MCPSITRLCRGSLFLILSCLTLLCESANSCQRAGLVGQCGDKYKVHVHLEKNSDIGNKETQCMALRTYMQCLEDLPHCKGTIEYHSSKNFVRNVMKKNKCSSKGPTYDGNNDVKTYYPPDELCVFKGKKVYKHCGLFGDPHIQTFNNKFQTCRVKGAWPLVSNKHFLVQVTNEAVSNSIGATATTKITVIIKKNDICANKRYIMYETQSGYLPSTFDDGQTYFGKSHSVELIEVDPGKHIEIKLKFIDTTIVVRQVGIYFTFALNMPEDLLNTTDNTLQLCVSGCPQNEIIDYEKFLAYREEKVNSAKVLMQRNDALQRCREAGLTDFFLDTCVFDLMMTGNDTFAKAASYAFQDIIKLDPGYSRTQANRTHLPLNPNSANSQHRTCVLDLLSQLLLTCFCYYLIVLRTVHT